MCFQHKFKSPLKKEEKKTKNNKESTKASRNMEPPTWLLKHTLPCSSYLSVQCQYSFNSTTDFQLVRLSNTTAVSNNSRNPASVKSFLNLNHHLRFCSFRSSLTAGFFCLPFEQSIFKCFAASRYCSRCGKKKIKINI